MNDPHFLVETLSGDWLCYTLKGIEGEVYNLLSDVEYSVNGLLIGTVFKGSALALSQLSIKIVRPD